MSPEQGPDSAGHVRLREAGAQRKTGLGPQGGSGGQGKDTVPELRGPGHATSARETQLG